MRRTTILRFYILYSYIFYLWFYILFIHILSIVSYLPEVRLYEAHYHLEIIGGALLGYQPQMRDLLLLLRQG